METELQEIIASMEANQAEVKDLHGKADSEKDEAKRDVILSMANDKVKEFSGLETQLEGAKTAAHQAKVLAEAKALNKPTRDINTNPENHPGKKDEETGETEGKDGTHFDTKQSHGRDFNAKRDIFFKGFSQGGLNTLTGQEAKNFAPSNMEKFCSPTLASPMNAPMVIPPHMFHAITANAIPDGKGGVLHDAQGKVMLSTDLTGGATDSGSGDTIDPNFIASLITRPQFIPTFKDQVTRAPAMNGRYIFPKLDYTQGLFAGVVHTYNATEGAAKTETAPTFTQLTDDTHELASIAYTSNINLTRSALDLEGIIINLMRDAWSYEVSRVILFGTGTNQALGIRADSGLLSLDRQVADQVGWKDINDLIYALSMGFRTGAGYVMDDSVEKFTTGTLDDRGIPLYVSDVNTGPINRLRGFPYQTHEYGAAESTPAILGDDADILFGNFNQYFLGVEQEIAIETSDHFRFDKGQRAIRMMSFFGGRLSNASSWVQLDEDTVV